jgi:hypothetical protein
VAGIPSTAVSLTQPFQFHEEHKEKSADLKITIQAENVSAKLRRIRPVFCL